MSFHVRRSRVAAAVGGIAVSLLAAACGPSTNTPASAPAPAATAAPAISKEHNAADIAFTEGMIPHHQQAVEMAALALTRAQNPEVKKLAEQIKAAQDPEIQLMLRFLQTWAAPAPTGVPGGGGHGGGHGGVGGGGMMTPEQMTQLGGAAAAPFDRMFLQMMIAHHEGAITSSQQELADGMNPQAKQLANQIIASQSAEITRMQQLQASV